jgi:hypothetical protein
MRTVMYGVRACIYKILRLRSIRTSGQQVHYNLFCHLIHIKPKPNNGTYSRVEKLLIESESSDDESGQQIDDEDSDSDQNNENGVPNNKLHSILIYIFVINFSYLMFYF